MKPSLLTRWIGGETRRQSREVEQEFARFAELSKQAEPRFPVKWENRQLCLDDKTAVTGFDGHYMFHLAWAARMLARTKPAQHVDIGSLLHFSVLVSAFIPVDFYDYRPAKIELPGLSSGAADLLALPFADRSITSLSCMHTVEHVGLGRYGDPIDPEGDLRAMSQLQRVLAPGGQLLFVVPVGRPMVRFNAHRIYAYRQVVAAFPELTLRDFALIPDDCTRLLEGATEQLADAQTYGCGCFCFERPGITKP